MARRQSLRVRSAARCLAALGMASLVVKQWSGPAYVVKSAWEGEPEALKEYAGVVQGLEPKVALPDLSFDRGDGLSFSVKDGHLVASYKGQLGKDTSLGFNVNDEQAWNADLESGASSLKVRGQGASLDGSSWEAATSGSADGLGDVSLQYNSDKDYKLTVVNDKLPEIAGTSLSGKVTAQNAGVSGRLEARRDLPGNVGLKWSHENAVGDYDLSHATEVAELSTDVAGGDAVVKLSYENQGLGYEGSYSRGIGSGTGAMKVSLKDGAVGYNVSYADNVKAIADVVIGVDTDGAYGSVSASRNVAAGVDAKYEAKARSNFDSESAPQLSGSLKLSNKLGYAQLLHSTEDKPKLRLGYEFNVDA